MVVRDQHRCIRFMVRGLGRAFLCWRAACSGISWDLYFWWGVSYWAVGRRLDRFRRAAFLCRRV